MQPIQIDNWRDYRRDGEQFLKTARGAFLKQKKTFSEAAIFNLTCMAIEKLIMAYLMKNGLLAENHTMGDLLRALEERMGPDPELAAGLTYLDAFQEICDLEAYNVREVQWEDLAEIVAIGEAVSRRLLPYLEQQGPGLCLSHHNQHQGVGNEQGNA